MTIYGFYAVSCRIFRTYQDAITEKRDGSLCQPSRLTRVRLLALMIFYTHSALGMIPALDAFAAGNDAARAAFQAAFMVKY